MCVVFLRVAGHGFEVCLQRQHVVLYDAVRLDGVLQEEHLVRGAPLHLVQMQDFLSKALHLPYVVQHLVEGERWVQAEVTFAAPVGLRLVNHVAVYEVR